VKGGEVKGFEKGRVYVVEGWATWCGPCRESIPHLTEMAHKNKDKATFIGVAVWEGDPAYTQKVEDFVAKMGDKMDYHVALDTSHDDTGHIAKHWLKAANQDGIPAAFIVNGEGKVAWIGHPMAMEKVLAKVIDGTWDIQAAAKASASEAANREKIQAGMAKINAGIRAKDYAAVNKAYDELIAQVPEQAGALKLDKFRKLVVGDPQSAYATARDLAANEFKNEPQQLNELAWTIVDNKRITSPDYDLALKLAEQAAAASDHKDGMILDTVAYAHFKKGNVDEAIKIQTKALELTKGMPEEMVAEMKQRLEEFKAAKKK
ncbi:MAG: redoxin family protein, partial [Phycisphaerales bacterium]|nr:redoxin family protein [Phycisphaerales bacterium]